MMDSTEKLRQAFERICGLRSDLPSQANLGLYKDACDLLAGVLERDARIGELEARLSAIAEEKDRLRRRCLEHAQSQMPEGQIEYEGLYSTPWGLLRVGYHVRDGWYWDWPVVIPAIQVVAPEATQ